MYAPRSAGNASGNRGTPTPELDTTLSPSSSIPSFHTATGSPGPSSPFDENSPHSPPFAHSQTSPLPPISPSSPSNGQAYPRPRNLNSTSPPPHQDTDPRLSMIAEDATVTTDGGGGSATPSSRPPRVFHRPFAHRWRDRPPRASSESSPPLYTIWDVSGPRGEKLMDLRNQRRSLMRGKMGGRRGGWGRLCLILLALLVVLGIALGVGLGVGLKKKKSGSSGPNDSGGIGGNPQPGAAPYPQGSYTLATNLASQDSSCTSQASAWMCYPFTTYAASSPNDSNATFTWIITNDTSSDSDSDSPYANLRISSSADPFAISFSDLALDHLDAGQATERLAFSFKTDKLDVPANSLSGDGRATRCFFNATTFAAELFLKKQPGYVPSNSSGVVGGNGSKGMAYKTAWMPWVHAVSINQTIAAGSGVPDCYEVTDAGELGDKVDVATGKGSCSCEWRNFGLG